MRRLLIGIALSTAPMVTVGTATASGRTRECVPSREGQAIVTAIKGVCRRGYTLTEIGTGPTGATGPVGATGGNGAAGEPGAKGVTGATGATGASAAGQTGLQGVTGAAGATGPTGERGVTGAAGPASASAVMGGSIGKLGLVLFNEETTDYLAASGLSTPSETAGDVAVGTPAAATTARNLKASAEVIGGHGLLVALAIDGKATSLRCAISTTTSLGEERSCSDDADTVSIPADATVTILVTNPTRTCPKPKPGEPGCAGGAAPLEVSRVLFGYETEDAP
jgi:collagen type VII alpha